MNVYERFIEELDAMTIPAYRPAVAVVGELTRAVKRAQMVVDGELRPVGEREGGVDAEPDQSAARRPDDDTRCPTCGGSAHALAATATKAFGGREYQHRHARKALDQAWKESDRLAVELDSTYGHLRAVIENCKHTRVEEIRHQLVGLLPEVQTLDPGVAAEMREKGMGHLVERSEWMARGNWSDYGYGEPPEGWEPRR